MKVEVCLDQASCRRYRRRTFVFLGAIGLVFVSHPARLVLTAMIGAETGEWFAHALILIGFLTALSSPLWGSWDLVDYRCPRCRRRLLRVSPRGVAEANYHYFCANCRVIWDLGWAWRSGGEGGG